MIKEIIINHDIIKGRLYKCTKCNINYTSNPYKICPLCEARISNDKESLRQWKKILE